MNDSHTQAGRQQVSVRLFGAFRQYSKEAELPVTVPPDASVTELRSAFARCFADNDNALALLAASVFATDDQVLGEADPVPGRLSILPPVCGG